MATLKLSKKTASASPDSPAKRRAPIRGLGAGASRPRPTLAQAQSERAEREARFQEQQADRNDEQRRPATRRQDEAPQRGRGSARPGQGGSLHPAGPERGGRSDVRPPRENIAFGGRTDARPARENPAIRRPDEATDAPRRSQRDAGFGERAPARGRNTAFGAPSAPRDGEAPMRRETRRPETPASRPPRPTQDKRSIPWGGNEEQAPRRRKEPAGQPPHAVSRPARPTAARKAEPADNSLRLSKRMSELGLASRREADEWIERGWVRVDGQVVRELGSRVTRDQHIQIEEPARHQQAGRVTVLINKPVGYVSGQAEDGYEPAVVLVTPQNRWTEDHSRIPFARDHLRHLAPAGRLDIDSVGLLILTQDGRIAKHLIGEDSPVEKEYLVRVQSLNGQPLPDSELALLRHGLELDGQPLRPAEVDWINQDQLRFVLREGKKRQIRRMCEAVGLMVVGLKRVRIGQVMLGDLPPGKWRYLRPDESFIASDAGAK